MNPSLSAYRIPSTPPTRLQRLEVTALDLIIAIVEKMHNVNLIRKVNNAWQGFDRLSATRQAGVIAVLGLFWFCLGLIQGAL